MIHEVKRPRKLFCLACILALTKYTWITFLMKNPSVVQRPSGGTSATKACPFRMYNETEYYPLDPLPQLLKDAKYIRGKYPVLLDVRDTIQKLCIDPQPYPGMYLSSDGMNPSIVSIERLNDDFSKPFLQRGIRYLATLCIKKAGLRCPTHNDRSENGTKTPLERSTFLIGLDSQFKTISQTIITTKLDLDAYGSQAILRRKHPDEQVIDYLDDARIFVFQNQLMVEFHSFQRFGKKMHQVSPLHVNFTGSDTTNFSTMTSTIVASETQSFCCGKNMAMLVHEAELQALEWIDPVSVIHLDKKGGKFYPKNTISDKIHGTNGFMVDLGNGELLGVGHFHRDDPSVESGTHYTHAFFTISATAPFVLLRLSNEWYIPSPQKSSLQQPEIIQFASGIDFVAGSNHKQLIISYGINDCEGAIFRIDMETIHKMLIPVQGKGKQVGDFMLLANATA